MLVTGTRDLFLSDTARVHRKLRLAGVTADLNVYEGLSHADYLFAANSPESEQVYGELGALPAVTGNGGEGHGPQASIPRPRPVGAERDAAPPRFLPPALRDPFRSRRPSGIRAPEGRATPRLQSA